VLKRTYFVAVIDIVFCLDARTIYKRETLSAVMLDLSAITGIHCSERQQQKYV